MPDSTKKKKKIDDLFIPKLSYIYGHQYFDTYSEMLLVQSGAQILHTALYTPCGGKNEEKLLVLILHNGIFRILYK